MTTPTSISAGRTPLAATRSGKGSSSGSGTGSRREIANSEYRIANAPHPVLRTTLSPRRGERGKEAPPLFSLLPVPTGRRCPEGADETSVRGANFGPQARAHHH